MLLRTWHDVQATVGVTLSFAEGTVNGWQGASAWEREEKIIPRNVKVCGEEMGEKKKWNSLGIMTKDGTGDLKVERSCLL